MSGSRGRRRPPGRPQVRPAALEARPARRTFGSALWGGGDSPMPPIAASLGHGLLAVVSSPVLLLAALLVPAIAWLGLLALGYEGAPARLVDVLALPPISTYFDLGTGASLVGIGPAFLVYTGLAIVVRGVIYGLLAGAVVDVLEAGRVTTFGVLRGVRAIPTVVAVQVLSFSLIVAGNLIFPILGPGIGFLAFVAALVGGLFFLGFAPTAAVRQGRPVAQTIRRSGRAAMLPGGRQLLFCSLYFFLALPVVVGLAPGGSEITANPSLATWLFVLVASVLHLTFMAALAYRWIAIEPSVPEEPVRRRSAASAQTRSRPRR